MTKISGSVPIKKAPEDTETRLAPRPGELHPWHGLRQEIDRLFDSFGLGWSRLPDFDPFRLPATPPAAAGFELSPQVDVSETDTAYEITAELPGLDKTDVDPSRKSGGALHRLHCFCLEFDGACEVQRRVPTDWIIEPIDVSGYGSFSLAS